jgi:hypothetical protein
MGWWSVPGTKDTEVGDEVLDETYRYLDSIAKMYREDRGKAMSVDDLAALWTVALGVHGGPEIFDGFEELEVSGVTIKTKKRPKRQRVQVGDVFAIPLGPNQWGFGRVVNLQGSWDLAEIYSYVSSKPHYTPQAVSAEPLGPPVLLDMDGAFQRLRWPIIHSDPGFKLEGLDQLAYVTGAHRVLRVNSYADEKGFSPAAAAKLPPYEFVLAETTADQVKDELKKRGLLTAKPKAG